MLPAELISMYNRTPTNFKFIEDAMKRTFLFYLLAALVITCVNTTDVKAQQFVYEPINPAFGENPMNYSWLMNSADKQNQHRAETQDRFQRDPLADFESSLQRQVLSQLTRDIVRRQIGDEGLADESRFEFGEFTIDLLPGAAGVTVVIQNILTGDETSITIPNF